jgi:alpha-tubulin suppressor-like RCC1 family protein
MAVTNRVSTRLLSKKILSGGVSFRYEGVVDFVGGRLNGQYIDNKTAAFNNVSCIYTSANNCDCCGDDGPPYYNCNYCNYYYLYVDNGTSIPSSSFSTSPSGGYYDSATNKGFKSFGYNGPAYGAQHETVYYTCATNCSGNATEAYIRANAAGDFFSYNSMAGIKAQDGSLWTWGNNAYGQLGNNSTLSRYSPVQVGTQSWKIVRGAYYSFAAIRQDDTLWTWGENTYGQLGDNSNLYRSSPVQILGSWKFISVGLLGMHGIKSDDTLWGWGYNPFGQIGDNSTSNRNSPVQVSGGGSWKYVLSTGGYLTVTHAIKTNGTAYGWGYGGFYTVGDASGFSRSSPVLVSGGFSDWSVITNHGYTWVYGIRSNGTLWGWGNSVQGLTYASYTSVPTQIGSATDHVSGSSHSNFGGVYVATTRNTPFIISNGNVISYNGYDATRTTLYGSGSAVEIITGTNESQTYRSGVYIRKNVI